jgi:hypothetical protein
MPFRFDPGFSVGHLLTALPTMVALVWLAAGYAGKTDQNQKQMDQIRVDMVALMTALKSDMTAQVVGLRSDVAAQMAQLQVNNDKQFTIVRSDIANIPGMKERVDQLDKRVDQLDSRLDAQSRRLEGIQTMGVQNSADIANFLRMLAANKIGK